MLDMYFDRYRYRCEADRFNNKCMGEGICDAGSLRTIC